MIQFYSSLDLSDQPEIKGIIYSKVKDLQLQFGDRSCACHPNYQWAVGVEFSGNNTYIVHEVITDTAKPCNFLQDILAAEIITAM